MTLRSLLPRNGFALLFCISFVAMLSGCISLNTDCKGCGSKCGEGGPSDEGCTSHWSTSQEKVSFNCPNGGWICNPGGTCLGGTCTVFSNGSTCSCGCKR